jgi:tetratricopeptide (TPR) repeat protein
MSLPPPGLPPEVGARTRIRSLTAELANQHAPNVHAALAYEIGALNELRLGETDQALVHYRDAAAHDPNFRPALFALARLLRAARDDEALVRVLARTVRASHVATDRAAALVELGCLLEDRLDDAVAARHAFERALSCEPRYLPAALMLESMLLGQNHRAEASRVIARRASHTLDPKLRAVLADEAARELAAEGSIEAAIETLLTALALPGRQLSTLRTLIELATKHDRTAVAARAFEDSGALLAAFANGARSHSEAERTEILALYRDSEHAALAAAFYYRSAGRLHNALPAPREALHAYERAVACAPNDVLLGLELAAAYEANDAGADARSTLARLLPAADSRRAAALEFQLAELAERQGETAAALDHLQSALAHTPDAPAISAVLEDRLLDAGALDELADVLSARANRLQGAERETALWRAALVADRAADAPRALALLEQLFEISDEQTPVLRELYGVALRAGLSSQLAAAAERLLACDIDHAERSALLRDRYEAALASEDTARARACLRSALAEPACEGWAAHAAWLVGALHRDLPLTAAAHAELAEQAERCLDPELAAAHLAARSRALLRAGDFEGANQSLRQVLSLSPANAYALALLEQQLLSRGETAEAAHLLREAALAERDVRRSEQALLHAGLLAEAAGSPELARSTYEEAAERDPQAIAPRWALLRLAERHRDPDLRLSALAALAAAEARLERPGSAHLELAEALAGNDQFEAAVPPLRAALDHEAVAFEAAATAVLLPRGAATDELRVPALSVLAEHTSRHSRRAFEHERLGELIYSCPADARTLLSAELDADDESRALLAWLSCDAAADRAAALEDLSALAGDPPPRAEFTLHALRLRRALGHADDGDALVSALGLLEAAPQALPTALALDDALSSADDPETRVLALQALREHTPPGDAHEIDHALARALYDAGEAGAARSLLQQLVAADPRDLSAWESLRLCARACADYEQVVRACDRLAEHASGSNRALLLEEAAAVLHERLEQSEQAEQRLRSALSMAPDRKPSFERLHDVLVERENLTGLIELLAERIAITGDPAERSDLRYERARILRAGGQREEALAGANELLASEPAHPGALGLCAEIYASREDWPAAIEALRMLAASEIAPSQKRLAIEGAADFLDNKLGDSRAAYNELAKLVQLDLADLPVHARMVGLAQHAGLQRESAAALERAAACSRGLQSASFERRAASLQLSFGQVERARLSLRRALSAHATDLGAFELLYASLPGGEQRDLATEFLEAVMPALQRAPSDLELLRALVRVGEVSERPVLAQIGLFALEALGEANRLERSEAAALRQRLPAIPRAHLDEALLTRIRPPQLSPELLRFGQNACAALSELRKDTPQRHGLSRTDRAPRRADNPVADALRAWLAVFELELSGLYVSENEAQALYPLERLQRGQIWLVGQDVQVPFSRAQRRALVPLLAAGRSGLLPLVRGDFGQAREAVWSTLVMSGRISDKALSQSDGAGPAKANAKLPRGLRLELEASARPLANPNEVPALLVQAVREWGQRANCLACGDLLAAVSGEDGTLEVSASSLHGGSGRELLRFWVSASCIELLGNLGMTP